MASRAEMEAAEAGDNEEGGDVFSQETGAGGEQQQATIVIWTRILDIIYCHVTVGRRAARQVRPQHPGAGPQGVPAPAPAGRPRPRGEGAAQHSGQQGEEGLHPGREHQEQGPQPLRQEGASGRGGLQHPGTHVTDV